jgi:hypothetical protein
MGNLGYTRISGPVSWELSKANLIEAYGRLARGPAVVSDTLFEQ